MRLLAVGIGRLHVTPHTLYTQCKAMARELALAFGVVGDVGGTVLVLLVWYQVSYWQQYEGR